MRIELTLPEVEAGGHLIEYLFLAGPANAGEALGFQDIAAWCDMTGYALTAWEAQTLRGLSQAYMGEYHAASDPKRPAPYIPEPVLTRTEVDQKVRNLFRMLKRAE